MTMPRLKGKNGRARLDQPRDLHQPRLQHQIDCARGSAEDASKIYLDPKWKGKMSIAGTTTGTQWIGALLETDGPWSSSRRLSAQEINVQNISGAALSGLVASGEVPLSPTIFNSNISYPQTKRRAGGMGPLDPVIAGVGISGMVPGRRIPMPRCYFSTTLFQRRADVAMVKAGSVRARNDVGTMPSRNSKKFTSKANTSRRV